MQTLGIITTNPALWAGAVGLGVPLVIHLLTRRTSRTLLFPSVRFLLQAKASQSAVYRWRHWLLLALRTLFLALVLAAFLKPVNQDRSLAAAAGAPDQHAVVVVLDASLSMTHNPGGSSAFGRARRAASQIINQLAAGDRANIIFAGANPRAAFPEPTANKFLLQRDLEQAQPTLERADPDAALALAVNQLRPATGGAGQSGYAREIHLVADFQRSNWSAVRWGDLPRDVKLVFVSVAEPADNCAITEILLQPPAPTALEDVELTAKVANYGAAARQLPLRLRFDDSAEMVRDLHVAPGTTAAAVFRLRANRPGQFTGELSIPEDSLPADDHRYFTLPVTDRVRVVVVSDEPTQAAGSAARQVVRALNPFGGGRGSIEVVSASAAQLDRFAINQTAVVILAGANALSESARAVLLQFLRDGGGVIWFAARDTDRAGLDALAAQSGGDLTLPVRWRAPVQRNATWAQANFDNPMLKPFQELRELGQIQFYRHGGAERVPGQGEILLRFDDRHVALAGRAVGQGTLLVANFGVALADSDLAKSPLFVPWIHQLVKGVRPRGAAARSFSVGEAATVTVPAPATGDDLRFTNPAGEPLEAGFESGKNEAAVVFPATKTPGLYRVHIGGRPVGAAAVNVDSRESDLRALTEPQLAELAAVPRERFLAAAAGDVDALQRLREGQPLWHYCLLGALVLLGVEQLLAAYWKR